ncbi:hypothetical protein MSSIH_3085 [Methanosarcina siciliae HI350]|uniref:Uncharacterized protein n=1 Tax=Methanosarcina siciliae HI350 TaxID=1434119 RepID=A0A0E3PH33_9EURY|nr:hypothetical protein [Methanosarcina siciliae]AKB33775.1 hypothetical protein MSSIH_3085 [Methanosarcina siciliae HI350]
MPKFAELPVHGRGKIEVISSEKRRRNALRPGRKCMKKTRHTLVEGKNLCYFLKSPYNYIQRMVNMYECW